MSSPSHLLNADKNRHPYLRKDNPYCPKCRLRECPRWGTHQCKAGQPSTPADAKRIEYWIMHMLTNLDFYRVPPDTQIPVFAGALAYAIGRMAHPSVAMQQFEKMIPIIRTIITNELGLNPKTVVADISQRSRGKLRVRRSIHAQKENPTPGPVQVRVPRALRARKRIVG